MSRIYDNRNLCTIPVNNRTISGRWNPQQYCKGPGVLIEGEITKIQRVCLSDSSSQKFRYYILFINLKRSHKRAFDSAGNEIEPNFSETRKISTGYLPSSYRTEAKGCTDQLSKKDTEKLLEAPSLIRDILEKHDDCLPLLIEEKAIHDVTVDVTDSVRLKSAGNSPFIETITRMDKQSVTTSNYTGGEPIGHSWTDKIMALKQCEASEDSGSNVADNKGDDDNDWSD